MMNTNAPDVTDGHRGRASGISPALDATLDLLSNRRRRYVLYYLREEGGAVTLDELAEQVTSWERDADDGDSTHSDGSSVEECVRADLYHSQLPRLEEAGAVTFDADEGYVTLAEHGEMPIGEYLDLAADEERVV